MILIPKQSGQSVEEFGLTSVAQRKAPKANCLHVINIAMILGNNALHTTSEKDILPFQHNEQKIMRVKHLPKEKMGSLEIIEEPEFVSRFHMLIPLNCEPLSASAYTEDVSIGEIFRRSQSLSSKILYISYHQ